MVNGTIVPGVRIGKCYIGEQKSKILRLFSDNGQVWDRGDGFCICTYDNVKLWFDTDGTLCLAAIGVKGMNTLFRKLMDCASNWRMPRTGMN